ncbi:MAG TPA: AmmeMemoRadiSam system radical SAM enzyme [Clostridia bacterium]|nr:AmmeMemoRadiSam system radical SAM enzyme [Clostridia bacterium]
MKTICAICPHRCALEEGQTGLCRARRNEGGRIVCANYGLLTSLALDPIEKKPLARFHPGSAILSAGSFGCNLRCSFCQNSAISMAGSDARTAYVSPQELVAAAVRETPRGNIGLAFTYNEPLVGYEYVYDCAVLAREEGLKAVLVTNGTVCEEPLIRLLPFVDAMNIDLKAFTGEGYRKLGGWLDTVKRTIELSSTACHVEVTTLVVPGFNDSEREMEDEAAWLASIDPETPLHISRFFPCYRMRDAAPTPVSTIYRLRDAAAKKLHYVYTGNC